MSVVIPLLPSHTQFVFENFLLFLPLALGMLELLPLDTAIGNDLDLRGMLRASLCLCLIRISA